MPAGFVRFTATLVCLTALSGAASAAAVSVSQKACDKAGQPACVTFAGPGSIVSARNITFAAPSRGTAVVTFHGYVSCGSSDLSQPHALALKMQIVEGGSDPDETEEGGMTVQSSLGPLTIPPVDNVASFNLMSTRTVAFAAAGSRIFRFRIKRTTVHPQTNCKVNVATFTVQFVP